MRNPLFALAVATAFFGGSSAVAGEKLRPIFSYEDYPPEALRQRWQGTVVTELTVATNGFPKACRVTKSSGYKILDDKTCELLITRAKFLPAKDEQGNPKEDIVHVPPVTWSLQN
jgi:TonB family protein